MVLDSEMARDTERKLAELPVSKITDMKASWRPVTCIVSQASILILILFNIFFNDLDNVTTYTARKFKEVTKLGGMFDRQYDCAAIQKDLHGLEN